MEIEAYASTQCARPQRRAHRAMLCWVCSLLTLRVHLQASKLLKLPHLSHEVQVWMLRLAKTFVRPVTTRVVLLDDIQDCAADKLGVTGQRVILRPQVAELGIVALVRAHTPYRVAHTAKCVTPCNQTFPALAALPGRAGASPTGVIRRLV